MNTLIVHRAPPRHTAPPPFPPRESYLFLSTPPSPFFSTDSQLQESFSLLLDKFFTVSSNRTRGRMYYYQPSFDIYIYISLSSWMEKQPFLPNLWGILDSSGLRNAGRGPVFPSPGATRLHSFRDFGRSFSLRRSMERGFSAGFPFLAGRRRGESLVPAGSLSFTFHAGREPAKPGRKGPRGRKPAARHGCTTKLARRVPVLSVSPRAWDDSTILYLAPTDPFPSLDGILNWQDAMNRRSRVVDRQIAFDPRGIKRFEPSVDGENRDRDRSRLKIMRANLKKEGEETLLRCLQ